MKRKHARKKPSVSARGKGKRAPGSKTATRRAFALPIVLFAKGETVNPQRKEELGGFV